MKKLIYILLLVALCAGLTGCYTCDICGEERFLGKNEESLLGEEFVYCDQCKEGLAKLYEE